MTIAAGNLVDEAMAAPGPAALEAIFLSAGYAGRAAVEDVSFRLCAGELVGIVGPNGCGKSTLLKAMSGELQPMAGRALLTGEPIGDLRRSRRSRLLATLPQHPDTPAGMTVRGLIQCGRAPHSRWFEPFGAGDHEAVDRAMQACGLDRLADRSVAELSGGERQRAWIAMTLAQQTQVLLLDEPTSALDIGHQLDVMQLLAEQVARHGLAAGVVMHDINLAARFCDRLVVMREGRVMGECRPGPEADWSLLEQAFGVRISTTGQEAGQPAMAFARAARRSMVTPG